MSLTWDTIRRLESQHGDGFYILDTKRFERNVYEFREAFRAIYPNTEIGYSCKTNSIPTICRAVHGMGGYIEVVSRMEYDFVTALGVPPAKIIFNGPLKCPEDLERALVEGAIVNLDSFDEVDFVEAIAGRMPRQRLAVGLRCNLDIGIGQVSRFGFDVDAGDLDTVFARLNTLSQCVVEGLHCHISTTDRSAASYARRTEQLLALADRYFTRAAPRYVDIGGGFFGRMPDSLSAQFGGNVPTFEEYAHAVAPLVATRYRGAFGPQLIFEPGMAVVCDVLRFVARVVGLKTVRGRRLALVNGSIQNVKPTMTGKNLALRVYASSAKEGRRLPGPVDIVGHTCLEHDCLYSGYPDEVGVGDYIVVDNMGAYTLVLKPPFIHPSPPILAYDAQTGVYNTLKRRETWQDVWRTYDV